MASAVAFAQPCETPATPTFIFTPPGNVGVDETYALAWSDTTTGVDDYFVIERSTSSSFTTILDSQEVLEPAASFLVDAEGRYYHRVRAVPACNPSLESGNSGTASVNVVAGSASVVVTVQPKPLITNLGDSLVGKKGRIVVENVTKRPVTVLVTEQELAGSPKFFSSSDPAGGNLFNLTLQPGTPKVLDIIFEGFNTDENLRRSYQGVIVVTGPELPIVTYAFVNLKIGGSEAATPFFRREGVPIEYVFFPGFSGENDAGRAPLGIEVVNPGSSALEVGGEVGPEIWLEPESGWNDDPIQPNGAIAVDLFTKRERALADSPLPRYTYFTVHTRDGNTSRLLVQDNDAVSPAGGRAQLQQSDTSYVIPGATSETLPNGRRLYTILTMANVGTTDLTTELFYTPDARDGFSGAAKRVEVIVPANDVVRLTDPLAQLFDASPPADGQIEIRSSQGELRFLNLAARTFTPDDDGVGGFGYRLPVVTRGEGARDDTPHTLPGMTVGASETAELILAESTGVDDAAIRLELLDTNGVSLGSRTFTVERYGQIRLPDLLDTFDASAPIVGARVAITVTSGKGSIVGSLIVRDASHGGFVLVSQPSAGPVSKQGAARGLARLEWPPRMFVRHRRPSTRDASGSVQYLIPNVVRGPVGSSSGTAQTSVGVTAGQVSPLTVTMTLIDSSGVEQAQRTVDVGRGRTSEFTDVIRDLFGIQSSFTGMILADASSLAGLIYARQVSSGAVTTSLALPIVTTSSPALTGGATGQRRPVYIDGVEQSTSASRGSRWSLVLNEVCNRPMTVEVRLYEAGNRVVPFARKQFEMGPFQELRLDTIFSALDLASDLRNKDRINVLVAVSPISGDGLLSAVALATDNRTGATTSYRLTPSGGIPASGVLLARPIPPVPVEEEPDRRRSVRRPN